MGLLTSAMLAEALRPGSTCAYSLRIGSQIRLAREPINSDSLGLHLALVKSFGTLSRQQSSWRGGLQAPTMSVSVDDTDRRFSTLYGRQLRGQTATLQLVARENVTAADFATLFSGVVDSSPKRGREIRLNLRQADDRLIKPVPTAPMSRYTFPALPPDGDAAGNGVPFAMGNLDSSSFNGTGLVPCPQVSNATGLWSYVVSLGWWPQVLRVFSANQLVLNTDYQVVYGMTSDARKVTLILFAGDQGANAITADIQDVTSPVGPAAKTLRALDMLVWADYHQTDISGTTPANVARFTALDSLLVTALELKSAYYIPPERKAGQQILKDLCGSFASEAWWTSGGQLAVSSAEYRLQDDEIYRGPGSPDPTLAQARVLDLDLDLAKGTEPEFDVDAEATVNRLTGKAGYSPAEKKFLNQRQVIVETGDDERPGTLEMPGLPPVLDGIGSTVDLRPNGTVLNTGWIAVGAPSAHQAVAQDPAMSGNPGIYIRSGMGADQEIRFDLDAMPGMVACHGVSIYYEAAGHGTFGPPDPNDDIATVGIRLGGVNYPGDEPIVGCGFQARLWGGTWLVHPGTGQPFTQADLNGAQVFIGWQHGTTTLKELYVHMAFARVSYTAAADVLPPILTVLSKHSNRYRIAPNILKVQAKLEWADLELGDVVAVRSSREGWGPEPWSLRLHEVTGIDHTPDTKGVGLTLEDIRARQTSFWLWGKALGGVDSASAAGDGMAFLTIGADVTMARASVKCLDMPAGIGIQNAGPVAQILANCWPSERRGTLLERLRTNGLTRSSFKSGTTGLTPSGTGVNGSSIAADATVGEQLCTDPTVTGNVLLFTAGTPHTTDLRETWPTTASYNANARIVLSFDHKDSSSTSGDGIRWRLVRNVDGWFWNNTTKAWQAGAVDNALPETLSYDRHPSVVFSVGSNATTLTPSLVLPSGGTSGRKVRVAHVQLEEGEWVSSRMVTDAATFTREADQVTIGNDKSDGVTTRHTFPTKHGTWSWRVVPLWSSADVTTGTEFWLLRVPHAAGNRWSLLYKAGTGWQFIARSAGVDYTATVNLPVTAATEYEVITRWTSSLGEQGKTLMLTLIIKAAGVVLGSAEVPYVLPELFAGTGIAFGHNNSTANTQIDGYIVESRASPFCLSDAELGL